MNSEPTKVDKIKTRTLNHPVLAVVIVFATIVIGISTFTEALQKLYSSGVSLEGAPAPKATVAVNQNDDGSATLVFKFFDIPKEKNVDWIVLSLEQTKPDVQISGNPSTKVRAAHYDALVPGNIFDKIDAMLEIEARLKRSNGDPYDLAELTLWWERTNSTVGFKVTPTFMDAQRNKMKVKTEPQSIEVTLANYSVIKGILNK